MAPKIRSLRTRMLVLILPPVALAIVGLTFFAISRATSQERDAAYSDLASAATVEAGEVDSLVRDKQSVARTVGGMLNGFRGGDRADVKPMIGEVFTANRDVLGVWATFKRNAFDGADDANRSTPGSDAKGIFTPYWQRLTGKDVFDISVTDTTAEYWTVPEKTGRAHMTEPYLYEGVLMTSFSAPILDGDRFIGVAGVDRSLASLDADVAKVKLLDTGYGMLVSRQGMFVAAPDKKLLGKTTLTKLAADKDNADLERVAGGIAAGRAGHVETTDPFTGKRVVLFWSPVATGKWGMVVSAPLDEVMAPVNRLRNTLLILGLVALLAVAGAIAFVAVRLSRPIAKVTEAAEKVSEGDLDVDVAVTTHDEVGRLAAAFGRSVDYLQEKADAAGRVAGGDLTVQVEPRSERDVLGVAFRKLVEDLRGVVGRVSSTAADVSQASQQ
ncbi:MAG: methyl-accepting chemotaxis protein, partial [Solirubrobacteraceae bacterium]|nr:methyl-accepting chemotaxis protein [Solirubrobacteraceae bacterium]